MRIELLSDLATDASQKGDHFQARVVEPKEYEGAIINGRVVSVKRPGRVKSTAQLQLSFDEIRFSDGRSARMSAQVIEVIPGGGSQGAGKVDSEGGVQGTSSTKQDVEKVGAATGIGAIIGAIAGGGVGAALARHRAGVGTARSPQRARQGHSSLQGSANCASARPGKSRYSKKRVSRFRFEVSGLCRQIVGRRAKHKASGCGLEPET